MKTTVIAFFNNKGGVDKTSLVYHLAWMYADMGLRVVAVDLDPQSNLSAAFVDEERLANLWPTDDHPRTILGSVQPLLKGIGDIAEPHLEPITSKLALLVGDLGLSRFEDPLSEEWPKCLSSNERSFRIISAFWRIMQSAATAHSATVILMDLGPNLGAINRAALIGADYVVVPLSPDLFSLQGLRNLGPTLRDWRKEWKERLERKPSMDLDLPQGHIQPAGYIVLQHSVRLDRPVKAYERWMAQIPELYRFAVLNQKTPDSFSLSTDVNCLKQLKHYRSLMPLAQEAKKPMFHLKSADGAIGAHLQAVQGAYQDFQELARSIAQRTEVPLP